MAAIVAGAAVVPCYAEESSEWARPVKKDVTYAQDSVEYVLFEGEWFQTTAKNEDNIVYGDVVLATNNKQILDLNRREDLKLHASMGLGERIKIVNDSLLILDFTGFESDDSVRLINVGEGRVFRTIPLNVSDTIVFGENTLGRSSIIRLSPTDNLAEIVDLGAVESEIVTPVEPPVVTEPESDGNGKLLYIVLGVVALIGILVAVFMLLRSRKNKVEPVDSEVMTDENNCNQDGLPQTLADIKKADVEPEISVEELTYQLRMVSAAKASLESQLESAKNKRQQEQESKKAAIDTAEARYKKEAEALIAKAEQRAAAAEEKSRTIREELTAKFEKQIDDLNTSIDKLKDTLSTTRGTLMETQSALNAETQAHNQAKRKIESLTGAIARFDDKLADAAFAQPYCRNIEKLLDISKKIQESANEAQNADVEDPYFICKAIARFWAQLDKIDLSAFYTDVDMVLGTGFVPKGTPLATYDASLPEAELETLVKNYFFASYLKQYVNALVVFNESMAGLTHLLPDMPAELVRPFEAYRLQLQQAVAALGINVLSVKIFDFVHNNTDLLATPVDGGYDSPGAILDIENCLVSLSGAPKDGERIRVKVQQ